jgi:L-fuconolactonase
MPAADVALRASRGECGSGSVLVLAIVGAVLAVSAALVPVLSVLVQSQRAANAADAAALAAADAVTGAIPVTGTPCELADLVARRNHARLVACETDDAEASVSVSVAALGFAITARARAGPPVGPPTGESAGFAAHHARERSRAPLVDAVSGEWIPTLATRAVAARSPPSTRRRMPFPVIDAHQHVWDPAKAAYDWLGPEMAPIDTAKTFDDLAPELRACGIDATILVQSADNADDTALMRETAAAHPEIVGIVGYAPLADAEATAAVLDSWANDSLYVGVRNLIHDLPDPDWLLRPEVDAGLGELEARGMPFDLVAVLPRHLELVPILSERHPELRIVIDHLAKPPIGLDTNEPWRRLIAQAAENSLVTAKVSGLYSATADSGAWTTEQLRPFFDDVLEFFGPQRLMYGGDWPISVLSGGYTRVWNGLLPLFDGLDAVDRERLLGRNAAEIYGIDADRLAALTGSPR